MLQSLGSTVGRPDGIVMPCHAMMLALLLFWAVSAEAVVHMWCAFLHSLTSSAHSSDAASSWPKTKRALWLCMGKCHVRRVFHWSKMVMRHWPDSALPVKIGNECCIPADWQSTLPGLVLKDSCCSAQAWECTWLSVHRRNVCRPHDNMFWPVHFEAGHADCKPDPKCLMQPLLLAFAVQASHQWY